MLLVVTLLWSLSFPWTKNWQKAAVGCPGGELLASLTLIGLRMPIALEQTRREWELGHRRLQQDVGETPRGEAVLAEVEAVLAELRRRVGGSFTLAELADVYVSAETWSREAVAEIEPASGWPRRLATVTDAAFHLYSRGALDYEP